LCREVSDSITWRRFCRIPIDGKVPHPTTLMKLTTRCGTAAVAVFQQGTYAPDATSRWMGSIAMDKVGDIAVGYSASSASINPAIRYTGRVATDSLGTLQGENLIQIGGGSQLPNLSRWGDYSAMTVDPADDCTFWYTSEYLKASGTFNWSTKIASFKFPSCQ